MREADIEALVVELDDVAQVRGRAVVEVGGASGKPAQDRSLEAADIFALAADHGAARVGDLIDLAFQRMAVGDVGAGEREHRQFGNVERRRLIGAGIGNADIDGQLDRVVADVGGVVAGAAEAADAVDAELVVEAGHACDVDLGCVEQLLAARH